MKKKKARERIELLLDEDSPFLELMPLAGLGQDETAVGASLVAGIGLVNGVECMVSASVATIKGGSLNEVTLLKSARLAEIAEENGLPAIGLVQSAGADLRHQAKVFHKGGQSFRDLARRSKKGYCTITVVFGNATAGGAYQPGMSDYTIMVEKMAKVFLAGPPLVKMATGEVVDDETLGGARMHSTISGVSDFLAPNEHEAIMKAREIVSQLHYNDGKSARMPTMHRLAKHHDFLVHPISSSPLLVEEPVYNADELLGIVPSDIRRPYDVREVIARIVDGSRFTDFKPLYGSTMVCCFATIHGIPVGILGNNGVIFSDSAQKGTQFIQLCNQRNTPLLFLQNITGFMVGSKYEQSGIIKYGSLLINAVSNSGVPAITIVIGASYGAGNYAMCGRAYSPRFLFSWPISKCSVMGPDQLAGVMEIILRQAAARSGKKINEEVAQAQLQMLRNTVEEEGSVFYTSSRCIDDGVIDPRDTRTVVGFCLSIIYSTPFSGSNTQGVSRL